MILYTLLRVMSLIIRKIGLLLTLVFDFALFSRNRTALLQSGVDAQRGQDHTVENQPSPHYQDGNQNALELHDCLPHRSFPLGSDRGCTPVRKRDRGAWTCPSGQPLSQQEILHFHDFLLDHSLHSREETPPQKHAITCRPSVRTRKRGTLSHRPLFSVGRNDRRGIPALPLISRCSPANFLPFPAPPQGKAEPLLSYQLTPAFENNLSDAACERPGDLASLTQHSALLEHTFVHDHGETAL